MKTFVILSTVAAVSLGTYAGNFGHGQLFGRGHGQLFGHGHAHGHAPLVQTVHHGAAITHGSGYDTSGARHGHSSGDLLGLHSFGYDGISAGLSHHSVASHSGFFPSYGGHNLGFHNLEYALPERSKLYGGYVGGFGGYAKGALDSIQHLNQGGLKLQAPLLGYGGHKISAPMEFGHAHLGHVPLAHYGGHLGVSGIGGTHYGLEYKKAKA